MAGLSKHLVAQWVVTWGLLGVVSGLGLVFGDTGHLPASWILIIVPVSAVVAGFIAAVGFGWALYLLPDMVGRNLMGSMIVGAIVGASSTFLLGWFVLGVQWRYAIIWGAVAGVMSAVVSLRFQTKTAEK
jgi:hypothetical protein